MGSFVFLSSFFPKPLSLRSCIGENLLLTGCRLAGAVVTFIPRKGPAMLPFLAGLRPSMRVTGPFLTSLERTMRFGFRFWSVAAVRDGSHDDFDALNAALASQNGQAVDANRNIAMCISSHVVSPPKSCYRLSLHLPHWRDSGRDDLAEIPSVARCHLGMFCLRCPLWPQELRFGPASKHIAPSTFALLPCTHFERHAIAPQSERTSFVACKLQSPSLPPTGRPKRKLPHSNLYQAFIRPRRQTFR